MNIFTITPDGSLRHASGLEADWLGGYAIEPSESTGDLFDQLDACVDQDRGRAAVSPRAAATRERWPQIAP